MRAHCLILLVWALGLSNTGCDGGLRRHGPPQVAPPPQNLRVMVVDDPALGAAIQREWLAHTENQVEVVDVSAEKAAAAQQLPADVVIYAPALLGQFGAADLLLPLDDAALAAPEYARDDVLPLLRTQEETWGRRTMAVPLGSPQLVLFYRADLLRQHNLQPPRTWKEYAELVEKFAEKPAGNDEIESWQPTAEPLAEGWAARLLMARAASSALHRDQLSPLWNLENLDPLIAGPPWVRALEELAADNRRSNPEPKLLTPVECFAKFQAGECALAITWPSAVPDSPAPQLQPEQVGLTLLPGSSEVFQPLAGKWEPVADGEPLHVPLLGISGRVASVSRASSQPRLATQFVLWISGPTASGRISPLSPATTVFRRSHFQNANTWQAPAAIREQLSAYGELLNSVQSHPRRFLSPRIQGQQEYLASLDAAVLAVVRE
jgi:ABC-type glycerol-3-phosphate transport system substrate-binding protein